ncbi:MAG TPA: protein kinase [Ktedonobacterales bacterium]|jgi:serine/threonine protein kinase|nr:protein kinase [Ktedonobacterales bacterium]
MQLDHQQRYPRQLQPEQSAAPIPQPPALAPGTSLAQGRYLIQGYIGGGGFGHIYRAQDTMLHHYRALKEAFSSDLHARRQFRLEAEFLLNVRHPNLVSAYAVFEENNRLYLVMDYIDGQTLEDIAINHIRKTGRPLGETQVLDWIIPICDAASALHQQPVPIIHRDIKPANIKLSISTGEPVLMDLGLAKLYARGTQTIGAALAFTPGYAPPEQYQAVGATDQRTDVYGLGATLYYLLTGYQPTEAPARLSAHALRAPLVLNPMLSKRTNDVVLRAMELDPAARQQTARELLDELAAARRALTPRGAMSGTPIRRHPKMPAQARVQSSGWLCVLCGAHNRTEARFCQRCGQPLEDQDVATRDADVPDFALEDSTPTTPAPHRVVLAPPQPQRSPDVEAPREISFALTASSGLPPVSPTPERMPWSRHLTVPTSQNEAWVSIFAFLAIVCAAMSLVALFALPALLFAIPAIILGYWSMRQRHIQSEFRWLGMGAFVVGVLWLAFWIVLLLTGRV